MLYEPDSAAVFDAIIPEYLAGVVYGALCEVLPVNRVHAAPPWTLPPRTLAK